MTANASTLQSLILLASPHFKALLHGLAESREALGSDLAETCTDSLNTQPADYDSMLRHCEALDWIRRSFFAPSVSQQAFGGLTSHGGIANTSDDAKKIHASWFAWRIVDRVAVESFAGANKSTKAKFVLDDLVKWAPMFIARIQGGAAMRKVCGVVVGFSTGSMSEFPRVTWDDDPKDEPACQAPVDDPPRCVTNTRPDGARTKRCECPRVPYAARPVNPKAIRHV